VAVLTVRYFGGTKLGIGGMARAYANAVKEVIAVSNVVLHEKMLHFQFSTTYSDIQKVEYILKKLGISEIEREFLNDGATWSITSTEEKLNQFKRERECMR
jgi:putative IMPACT (imprinted ancient) family translation regulator